MIYAIKKIIKKMGQSISPKDVIAIDRIVSADHEFEGKNVFISGGSGGIGLAIARLLLESGANVVLGGTNQEKLDSCVRDLGYDGRVSSVVIDLLLLEWNLPLRRLRPAMVEWISLSFLRACILRMSIYGQ